MDIRKKALKLILITVSLLLIIIILLSRFIYFREFRNIEKKQIKKDINLLYMVIDNELERINSLNGDWAPWDDTYQFINDKNKDFIKNNLGNETFLNLDISFAIFINNNNKLIYKKTLSLDDANNYKFTSDFKFTSGMLDHLIEMNKEIKFINVKDFKTGIMIYQNQAFFVSFRPILKSEFKGGQNGTLIMGRHLDNQFNSVLSSSLKMPIDITIKEINNIIGLQEYKAANLSVLPECKYMINLLNKQQIAGKLVVSDLAGKYGMVFRLVKERDIYNQGLRSMLYLLCVLLIVSVIFSCLIYYLLNKTVFIFNDEQQVLLNTLPAMISFKDTNLKYISANKIFLEDVDCNLEELKGKDDYDLFPTAQAKRIRKWDRKTLDNNKEFRSQETQMELVDGRKRWFSGYQGVYRDSYGKVKGLVSIMMDITEQRKLKKMAYHDFLTGLPNKAKFLKYFNKLTNNGQGKIAIIYMDIDRFRLINNYFGHHIGDEFLQSIVERLKENIIDNEMAARFGGDEFAIMLPIVEDLRLIEQKCLTILKSIKEPWEYQGQEFQVSASAGVVIYPDDGGDINTLLKNADLAMYYAKDNDLDLKFFTDSLGNTFIKQLTMENDLRSAIDKNELELHYQPLLELKTGNVNTAEALLRWNHSKEGLISPDEFIPLAEKSGLIITIGEWVLVQACQQIVQWNKDNNSKIRVAINFSVVQFNKVGFIQSFKDIVNKTGVNPKFLEVEVSETILMNNPKRALNILRELKEIGVMLVLDDFGTGYSSLSYLKKFPFDKLKIDRSFIMDLFIDNHDTSIVKTILTLAQNIGLTVTAEGVETGEQLEFLQKFNCDEIQGYYVSRPVPAEEFNRKGFF